MVPTSSVSSPKKKHTHTHTHTGMGSCCASGRRKEEMDQPLSAYAYVTSMHHETVGFGIECVCLEHGFMVTFDRQLAHVTWRGKKVREPLPDVSSYTRGYDPFSGTQRFHALTLLQKNGTVTLMVVDTEGKYREKQWKERGKIEHMFTALEPQETLVLTTQYVYSVRFCQLRNWQIPVIQWPLSHLYDLMNYR